MKKIFGILCAGSIALLAASCGGNKTAENDSIVDTMVVVEEEVADSAGDTTEVVEAAEIVEETPAEAAKSAAQTAKKSADKAVKNAGTAVKEEAKNVEQKAQTASEKAASAVERAAKKTQKVAEEGLDDAAARAKAKMEAKKAAMENK